MARIRPQQVAAASLAFGLSLTMSACGSDNSTSGAGKEKQVAYLMASSANTYIKAAGDAMDEVAKKNNVKITGFDAEFKLGVQSKQIQDIVASGKYDGIVINTADGVGVLPDLEEAIKAGIEVALINNVVGSKLDTADPQFEGVAASVLQPPTSVGERLGQVTVDACKSVSPCNVVYFYGIKGSPLDTALRQGVDKVTSENPDIRVVAEAEGKYLGSEESQKAMRTILEKTHDIQVVAGGDQSIQGAQLALSDTKVEGVKLIGIGGSTPAIAAIKAKEWFGGMMLLPKTEARIAMEALIKAMDGGKKTGGVDPAEQLKSGVLITQDNVDEFTPEFAG